MLAAIALFLGAPVLLQVTNAAQVMMPAAASLDIQVPVAPTPVRIAGRPHLAYELHITNFRTVDVTLTLIAIRDRDRPGSPLATFESAALRDGLARVGQRPDTSDKRTIAPGGRVIFFIWLPLDPSLPLPSSLKHDVAYAVATSGNQESSAIGGGAVDVRRETPVVLGPPLRGGPWAAVYDPSLAAGHRRAVFAIEGRARIPARFAIDWVKVDGNGYGEDVLAVADGTIAAAIDRFPEPTVPIALDNAAGNYVTLDLGGGRFAFYEHLRPGSVRVRAGDRVTAGQVLASLGASGSVSSGAHLHFHVADANSSLGAEGVPFVLRRFERLGAFESLAALGRGERWIPSQVDTRQLEMPRDQAVVRF
jgi:murein DD-endopeptidase